MNVKLGTSMYVEIVTSLYDVLQLDLQKGQVRKCGARSYMDHITLHMFRTPFSGERNSQIFILISFVWGLTLALCDLFWSEVISCTYHM